MRTVLFLCTGNSCRSQMAEAIVNARLAKSWQAFSAGTAPTGAVHPKAIRVLSEFGIEHKGRSKPLDDFKDKDFNLVITVCDDAEKNCPLWLGEGKRIHKGFPDPATATGTEDEVLSTFRAVRDDITDQIIRLLSSYELE